MKRPHLIASYSEAVQPHDASQCTICRNKLAFEIPDHLLDALQKGDVVLFAGAGVSTETKAVFQETLYREVSVELKLSEENPMSFPDVMELFCAQPDGRKKLLQKIQKRFAYISSFQELYRSATRFHKELASVFYIQEIVTTNWDDYFERECGAIPLVTPDDFAFWDIPGRKVFKIHGSINNVGSIVASRKDYEAARARLEKGTLGSALKLLLATKTILYVGYSFTDDDFTALRNYIQEELGELAPRAYIVTLDKGSDSRFREIGLNPIYTDAAYFLSGVKKHLEKNGHYLPDERFDGVSDVLQRVMEAHEQLSHILKSSEIPAAIYCAIYQDGLLHALERIIDMKKTGEYSHICLVIGKLKEYERIRSEKVKSRQYTDVAYVDGYSNGLLYLLVDDRTRREVPIYYLYGLRDQLTTVRHFKRAVREAKSIHKGASAHAKKVVAKRLGKNDVIHHTPFL